MKKLFFILVIACSALIVNAQTQKDLSENNTSINLNTVSNFKMDSTIIETPDKKRIRNKNRKGFIKKVLSSYEGFDLRNAWGLLSQRQ